MQQLIARVSEALRSSGLDPLTIMSGAMSGGLDDETQAKAMAALGSALSAQEIGMLGTFLRGSDAPTNGAAAPLTLPALDTSEIPTFQPPRPKLRQVLGEAIGRLSGALEQKFGDLVHLHLDIGPSGIQMATTLLHQDAEGHTTHRRFLQVREVVPPEQTGTAVLRLLAMVEQRLMSAQEDVEEIGAE